MPNMPNMPSLPSLPENSVTNTVSKGVNLSITKVGQLKQAAVDTASGQVGRAKNLTDYLDDEKNYCLLSQNIIDELKAETALLETEIIQIAHYVRRLPKNNDGLYLYLINNANCDINYFVFSNIINCQEIPQLQNFLWSFFLAFSREFGNVNNDMMTFHIFLRVLSELARGPTDQHLKIVFNYVICDPISRVVTPQYATRVLEGLSEDIAKMLKKPYDTRRVNSLIRESFKLFQPNTYLAYDNLARAAHPEFSECFDLFLLIQKLFENLLEISSKNKEGFIQKNGFVANSILGIWKPRFILLVNGFLIVMRGASKTSSLKCHWLQDARVTTANNKNLVIKFSHGKQIQIQSDESEFRKWESAFRKQLSIRSRPYDSFSHQRTCQARWFVDGRPTFYAMKEAINSAKQEIFIADWYLSPEVVLVREQFPLSQEDQLEALLLAKAKQGVQIYIIIWNETKLALELGCLRAKEILEKKHENIRVLCHPLMVPAEWSHHQKLLIVDQDIAFVGGLDLAFGRYDDFRHKIFDDPNRRWPGKDYYNPLFETSRNLNKPHDDNSELFSNPKPRMPWHDVHLCVDGLSAREVAVNFIQRWNYHKRDLNSPFPSLAPRIDAVTYTARKATFGHPELQLQSSEWYTDIQCILLRSCSLWSARIPTEVSIAQAYYLLIEQSKHFIYIENQYFISDFAGGGISNRITTALFNRIKKAVLDRTPFKCVIVIPIHPEGSYKDPAIRYVMHWQFKTICRGNNSLLERLKREFPTVNISDYIEFFSLRGFKISQNKMFTEQIYVHTKCMIIDDDIAIIGSANINDRSLLGDRDSEICAMIKSDNEKIPITMAGYRTNVSKFVHELRTSLWLEHLGYLNNRQTNSVKVAISDPISQSSYYDVWLKTAQMNTEIYENVFGTTIPCSAVLHDRDFQYSDPPFIRSQKLSDIRGHLVLYPQNFLKNVDLSISIAENPELAVAGDKVFQ
eukprot:TRINITY_DN2367_c0_g4_i1.p1 TRINITY_DN2367_c0_g4~~TRINITY_DN2367_c0_g4_i1.p1  ORF type:complete len:968 (+),score=331.65 TRINITY_DN2367_c0_g4_i1:3-2906(+)